MPRTSHRSEAANAPGADEAGWVCVGVVTKPKGVHGAVRVKSFTAEPGDITAYGPLHDGPGGPTLELELREIRGDMIVARVAGVADRDAAEALRGKRLYVPRAALPEAGEDEYYHADLVGLAVELADGARFGTVHALHDFGAGVILEVARDDGDTVMLPFTRRAVPEIDIAGGRMVIEEPDEVTADPPGGEAGR